MKSRENREKEQEFRYDAFISYRHLEPDLFVTKKLHKLLESFRVPKKLRAKTVNGKREMKRVFRDQEELPLAQNLEDPIVEALKSSKWLIVICSPKLKESMWCRKEIETFINGRGIQYVMPVLVDGEPGESFPKELLDAGLNYYAADFRGEDKKQIQKNLESHYLQVVAPIFGLELGELKKEWQTEKNRKKIVKSALLGTASFAFAAYFTLTSFRIRMQRNVILNQYDSLSKEQAKQVAEQSMIALLNDDRQQAVSLALQALTEYEGIPMPYTDEAAYALMQSMRPYDMGDTYRELYKLNLTGMVEEVFATEHSEILVVYDSSDTLTAWDAKRNEILFRIEDTKVSTRSAVLTNTGYFAFINEKSEVIIYDVKKAEPVDKIGDKKYDAVFGSTNRLFMVSGTKMSIYDTVKNKKTDQVYVLKDFCDDSYIYEGNQDFLFYSVPGKIWLYDLSKAERESKYSLEENCVIGKVISDKNLFCVSQVVETQLENTSETFVYPLGNSITTVINYDGSEWKISFMIQVDGTRCVDLKYVELHDKSGCLAIFDKFSMELWNIGTKEKMISRSFPAEYLNSVVTEDGIVCFLKNGKTVGIVFDKEDSEEELLKEYLWDFYAGKAKEMYCGDSGFLVLTDTGNSLLYYGREENKTLRESKQAPKSEKVKALFGNDAVEAAQDMALDNPKLVNGICYDPEKDCVVVSYANAKKMIYDTVKGQVLYEWYSPEYEPILEYLGTDANGNRYFKGESYGYIISKEGQRIGEILHLTGIDAKEKLVYLTKDDEQYFATPLYSMRDLIEEAKLKY